MSKLIIIYTLDTSTSLVVGTTNHSIILYLHKVNKLTFFLLAIVFTACTEISYKEPQPKGIKILASVPEKLHGTYLMDGDTVTFFAQGFRAMDNKKEDVLYLSDSITLKKYKNYYFVSYREGYEWLLRILKPQKNGDLLMLEMDHVPDDVVQRKQFIETLSKETPVIETTVDSVTHFVIDPSAKKLYDLIQKGFFKEKKPLVKIN